MLKTPDESVKRLRVAEFATCELILDILFSMSTTTAQDLESSWILICVMHNTMRNLITEPEISAKYLNDPAPPEFVYQSMSRRAIADKTGLSRETVRRRTNDLIKAGLFVSVSASSVRLARVEDLDAALPALNQVNAATAAYVKRLLDHKVSMPL